MTNTPDKSELKADARQAAFNRYCHIAQPALVEWLGGNYTSRDIHAWCQGYAAASSRPPADQVPDMVEMKLADLHKAVAAEFPSDEFVFSRQRAIDLALAVHMKIAALQAVPAASEVGWQPIESAPYDTPVRVKLGNSMTPDASMNDEGKPCDQWPECWTDGACWESNADGLCSMQPRAWTALKATGEE